MKSQLRTIAALILFITSSTFSLPVSAEGKEACVAPFRQLGYLETWAQGVIVPECNPTGAEESDESELCVRQGPPALNIGLSTSSGSLAMACPSPYEVQSSPAEHDSDLVPEEYDCNTIINTYQPRQC